MPTHASRGSPPSQQPVELAASVSIVGVLSLVAPATHASRRPRTRMPPNNITVAVRVRPLSGKEKTRGAFPCIVVQEGRQINVIDPDDKM